MKKYLSHSILLIVILITSISCSKGEPFGLTFVFDAPISEEKYPQYFRDISMPFETGGCSDFDYVLLKPISVVRGDIRRSEVELNAWHFENIAENTIEFSKNWLSQFFTDSIAPNYLKQEAQIKFDLTSYIANNKDKADIYIYSEDYDKTEYNGISVFQSGREINENIKATVCSNTNKKVVVIVNPSELKVANEPIDGGDEITTPHPPDPCNQPTLAEALDLKEELLKAIDVSINENTRIKIAEDAWDKYFDTKCYVANYKSKDDKNPDVWNPGEGKKYFTNRLAVLESIVDISIFRIETSQTSGKISGIHLIECHNFNELL